MPLVTEPNDNTPVIETNPLSKNYTDTVDSNKIFEPFNPLEKYLAKMNGEDVDIPNPTNGLEYQVKKLAESGGSGGGTFDFHVTVSWDDINDIYSIDSIDDSEEDLLAAINAGNSCRAIVTNLNDDGVKYYLNLSIVGPPELDLFISFSGSSAPIDGDPIIMTLYGGDGDWWFNIFNLK